MNANTTSQHLKRLLELILQERECAKNLDTTGMNALLGEKEQLIKMLSLASDLNDDDKEMARKIRHENRRNAYLYKSALGWIRETMEFFGRNSVPSTYSANAYRVNSQVSGRLLSGRV